MELIRLPRRRGKTAAENAAVRHARGEIIVNSDASVREPPSALTALIARFGDPTVGVASGRDLSVSTVEGEANQGESGYTGYEMWIRRLETKVAGIVGASGCFYAIRAPLLQQPLPEGLSRDFAAPLTARQHGYRAVSVEEAVVYVPRIASLRREYRRKVRTMTRGMKTCFYKRALLNPLRYRLFAWELFNETDLCPSFNHKDIVAWHREMSAHLKASDPYRHLVTTSLSVLAAGLRVGGEHRRRALLDQHAARCRDRHLGADAAA